MSSPPKPWEVNPEGQTTPTTGDGSAAPVADGLAGAAGVNGAAGTTPAARAGLNSGMQGSTLGAGGLGSSYMNRSSMYGGSGMYGGGMGSYGGYGGMGGMYGGMGGMGMMGMGMGMSPGEQKAQMMMMLMNRLGEMVSGFAQMLQVAMNNILVCFSNLASLHTQYHSVPEVPQEGPTGVDASGANGPTVLGLASQQPTASSASPAVAQPVAKEQGEELTLFTFAKRLILLYLIWRLAKFVTIKLDKWMYSDPKAVVEGAAAVGASQ